MKNETERELTNHNLEHNSVHGLCAACSPCENFQLNWLPDYRRQSMHSFGFYYKVVTLFTN